jgi:Flp pilus assembly protein TadD
VPFIHRSVFFIFLAGACYGQSLESLNVIDTEIRGHVRGAQSVELIEAGTQNIAGRSSVDRDGTFVLNNVIPGAYVVRIVPTSANGIRPEEVEVSVGGNNNESGSAPITGTVSAGGLAHPPSKTALKYLTQAQHYSEAGNSAKAIEVLRNAPVDAAGAPYLHSRLGTEYLKSGEFALALPELEEAARLMPKEAVHHSNLAYVYQALFQMERAEKEARLAVDLDHSNSKAHFLLGSILLDRPAGISEAIANLKLAQREVPSARFLLGQVYLLSGEREAAQREIADFLSVATDAQRAAAQQWLARHSAPPNQVPESAK